MCQAYVSAGFAPGSPQAILLLQACVQRRHELVVEAGQLLHQHVTLSKPICNVLQEVSKHEMQFQRQPTSAVSP